MQDCLARIVGGNEDVMGVDHYTAGEAGNDFEILAHDIAADRYYVTWIQKQKIAALQAEEYVEVYILDVLGDEMDAIAQRLLREPIRVRVNCDQLAAYSIQLEVLIEGRCHDTAAVAAAHFHDPPRLVMANHAVGDLRIHSLEEAIVVVVAHAEKRRRVRLPFGPILRNHRLQENQLPVKGKVQPRGLCLGWPVPRLEFAEVGHRPVVVVRTHCDPDALEHAECIPDEGE